MLNALASLASLCDQLGVIYMLYGGTLLGSFRHHDMVPWDDDMDIVVDLAARPRLLAALDDLRPDYMSFEYGGHLKFWSSTGSRRHASWTSWQWPYVDVSFYDENATHIWDASPEFRSFVYPKSMVFPTHLRPLASLWLPAPRDTLAFLVATYPTRRHCSTGFYSHKLEEREHSDAMRCRRMRNVYPFVHRRPAAVLAVAAGRGQRVAMSPGIVEVLMLGDVLLYTAHVEEASYTVDADPYMLPTRRRLNSLLADNT